MRKPHVVVVDVLAVLFVGFVCCFICMDAGGTLNRFVNVMRDALSFIQ